MKSRLQVLLLCVLYTNNNPQSTNFDHPFQFRNLQFFWKNSILTMKPLGKDELELISKKLTFSPDYTRFRSVCKSWRSAAPKRLLLPWLIVRDRIIFDTSKSFFKFYEFSFETNKFLQILELSELSLLSSSSSSSSSPKMDCICYSHGWLVLLNQLTSSIALFNPLTNSIINLPVLKNFHWEEVDDYAADPGVNFYLTSDPGESISDCFALIYIGYHKKIWFCKVGHTDWTEIVHPEFDKLHSIHICCYHGQTFFVSNGYVFVCDFGLFGCKPGVRKIVSYTDNYEDLLFADCYLVESDGDLLLVYRFFDNRDYFKVFKLEFDREMAKLVELKSLGDKALFLSPRTIYSPTARTIFSLTASGYPGCNANSIYFTNVFDDDDERTMYDDEGGILRLRIYDFEKGSTVIINDNDVPLSVEWGHCRWFTPSLLK